MHWVFASAPKPPEWLKACVKRSGFRPEIQQLLLQKSFRDEAEYEAFLSPSLKNIEPPEVIENVSEVVRRLHDACMKKQRIVVVSDYDVDGVTSMVLLHRFFHRFGYEFIPVFPNREKEGYGLTEAVTERILSSYAPFDLLMATDCGTNSVEAVQRLRDAGVEVLIIDHHQRSRDTLPNAVIINPHLSKSAYSQSALGLCTAGLIFKCLHAWLKILRSENVRGARELRLSSFLHLVALATVADLVPLDGDNRLFAAFGLRELQRTASVGLRALSEVCGGDPSYPLTTEDIAFKLAPHINVGGRLESAEVPFELLTSDDEARCCLLARQLALKNAERQETERRIAAEAEILIRERPHQRAYVLYQPHWHVGVVGIVAGRLTRKYHCPVFVLGQQNGFAKGSGRSIEEVNLTELFSEAQPLLRHWGGHPAAAGLEVEIENILPLEARLNEILHQRFQNDWPQPMLSIASVLSETSLTEDFLAELEHLAPFGHGNEMPIFALKDVILTEPAERFGKHGAHLRLTLNGHRAVAWGMGDARIPQNKPLDFAVQLGWSCWNGRRTLQVQVADWRMRGKEALA